MKKIFTLGVMAVLAIGTACAQGYRQWDFTRWSTQTVENLKADAAASSVTGWSDIEKKADAGEGKVAPEATAGKCFWLTDPNGGALTANGVTISELDGLTFGATYTNNRSLAIAVDYPSTSLGEYAGPQYLWLGGGGKNMVCFTIPNVRVGQKITMTVESHKPSDARGVELYVGAIAAENKIGESFKPTVQETYTWEEWELPAGATLNDDGETVDVIVYNTSGCHIYKMEVGDNTQKSKVAYLYGGSLDAELAYPEIAKSNRYTVEAVEANGALSFETLTEYDAIVISSTVTNAEAISSLSTIQPFVPTLNLNPAIYAAWGVGQAVDSDHFFANLKDTGSPVFNRLEKDVDIFDDPDNEGALVLQLTVDKSYQGVTLAGRFADDRVLATVYGKDDVVAIHQHSANRNSYVYIPYTQDVMTDATAPIIMVNALEMLTNTKTKVMPAPAPTFSLEHKNMNTNVTIKSTVLGAEIFYTTDGSQPTEQSTRYTGPFNLTAETTVKAVARGEGYLLSDVAEQLVDMQHQLGAPAISLEQQDGQTVIDFLLEEVGTESPVSVYYNYSGVADKAKSSLYSGPVTVTIPGRTVYAFASSEGFVDSELASKDVPVQNPKVRIDVLSHMDANSEVYNGGSTSTAYYFSWGKNKSGENGYFYYNPDAAEEQILIDPETGEETVETIYNELNPEEEKDFENGWMLRSRGQLVVWENQSTGTDFGNSNSYNFATVNDENPYFPVTRSYINLADKNTQPSGVDFPYNAYIVTTQKIAGPFDVVANIGSITKPESPGTHQIVLQVAADGNQWESNWETLGDTIVIENSARLTRNFTRSYEGTGEVYVRAYLCANNSKVGFYDIYIANAGEKTQELLSGIEEVAIERTERQSANRYYDLQGRRLNGQPVRGLYILNGKKYLVK